MALLGKYAADHAAEDHLHEFVGRILGHGPRRGADPHVDRRQDRSHAAGERARRITSPARNTARRHFRRERCRAMARTPRHRRAAAESDAAHDRLARTGDGARSLGARRRRTAGQQVSAAVGRHADAGRALKWPALTGVAVAEARFPNRGAPAVDGPARHVAVPRAAGR